MNATLESGFLEMSHTATTTKDLSLDNVSSCLSLARDLMSLLRCASYISERNGNLIGAEQSSSLVFVEFHSASGERSKDARVLDKIGGQHLFR